MAWVVKRYFPLDERTYAPVPRNKYMIKSSGVPPPQHWIPPKLDSDPELSKFTRGRPEAVHYRCARLVWLVPSSLQNEYLLPMGFSVRLHTHEMRAGPRWEKCCHQQADQCECIHQTGVTKLAVLHQWQPSLNEDSRLSAAQCQGELTILYYTAWKDEQTEFSQQIYMFYRFVSDMHLSNREFRLF